ncbi:MAG: TIGR02206 family membrane protein [Pseudonocardiaceae bacterium]
MELLVAEREFAAYSLSHWLVLLVFAAGAGLLVRIGRRHRSEADARRFSRVLAVAIFALYLAILLYSMVPPSIHRSVPLQLSDLASLASGYALWSHRQWAFVLTYYWGLVLSTQALVSPVLTGPDFPHYGFLAFWGIHLLVVWAAIYLTWGLGMRPGWRSYRIVVAVTVAWAAFTFTFNSLAGTNYGFLNAKPDTPSLLDVLGPWPWYLVPVIALVLGTWALMTWPWVRSGRVDPART